MNLLKDLQKYTEQINSYPLTDNKLLEAFRIEYLGTKGIIKQLFERFKTLPPENKKEIGKALNTFKNLAENHYKTHKEKMRKTASFSITEKDFTLPTDPLSIGSRHPIMLTQNRILSIFEKIGFTIEEGPEIEDEWHNFTALNMPENHPARDMQDTFYLANNPSYLLRTHTSNTQIRAIEKKTLPLRIICPGKVYRNETISARAHCFFHQIEGLYVATKVSFSDLKQTLYFFVQKLFGENIGIRFRPSYFPFTEPSAEMDTTCLICNGKGCSICKQSGWLEILGSGMVHPKIFTNCGLDADKYRGFAFGLGIERITMLLYQIKDIRLFSENDIRFLQQFTNA